MAARPRNWGNVFHAFCKSLDSNDIVLSYKSYAVNYKDNREFGFIPSMDYSEYWDAALAQAGITHTVKLAYRGMKVSPSTHTTAFCNFALQNHVKYNCLRNFKTKYDEYCASIPKRSLKQQSMPIQKDSKPSNSEPSAASFIVSFLESLATKHPNKSEIETVLSLVKDELFQYTKRKFVIVFNCNSTSLEPYSKNKADDEDLVVYHMDTVYSAFNSDADKLKYLKQCLNKLNIHRFDIATNIVIDPSVWKICNINTMLLFIDQMKGIIGNAPVTVNLY